MPLVMFTLALLLNYHVHLISEADELGGLGRDGSLHVQNLKIDFRIDRCSPSPIPRTSSDHCANMAACCRSSQL